VDVVIGDFVYELQFRLEKDMPDGEPQVIDMDATMDEDNPEEEKEGESMDEDGKKNDEQPAEHANDKQPPAKGLAEDQHKRVVDSQHGIDGGAATATNGKKPIVVLTPSGVSTNGAAQWKASPMPNINAGTLNKTKNGGDSVASEI
jgi:hypothetical protein